MDYYNWRRPHCHNDGMPPAKAEERPNQVSGFSWPLHVNIWYVYDKKVYTIFRTSLYAYREHTTPVL